MPKTETNLTTPFIFAYFCLSFSFTSPPLTFPILIPSLRPILPTFLYFPSFSFPFHLTSPYTLLHPLSFTYLTPFSFPYSLTFLNPPLTFHFPFTPYSLYFVKFFIHRYFLLPSLYSLFSATSPFQFSFTISSLYIPFLFLCTIR